MSHLESITHPDGRTLSDGHTYRAGYMGHGSGYEVYREGGENFVFCGRIYPKADSERAIVAAVEHMLRDHTEADAADALSGRHY